MVFFRHPFFAQGASWLVDMCENREPTNDVNAIREELSALLRLSREKLDEMKQIQARIDEMTAEIERLTEELEREA